MEHQTERNSTVGDPSKPMGERGAVVRKLGKPAAEL
jgi:hypothetical protein